MTIHIRKWATFREEIVSDGERELERPLRRVAVAVVCSNPYAGRWSDDLAELIDFGEYLGDELTRRCQEALGEPVEAYGKGGIVGEHGELEHVAAVLHPKFGQPTRTPHERRVDPPVGQEAGRDGRHARHPGPPHQGDARSARISTRSRSRSPMRPAPTSCCSPWP